MGGAKRVIFALGAFGEARQAAALADRADTVAAPGQNFMRITLVADVPNQSVAGRIEDMMQRNRQLHDAEAGAKVSAGLGYRVDEIVSQLIGNFAQPCGFEPSQIFRGADLVKKRSFGWLVQRHTPSPRTKVGHGTFTGR